MFSGLCGPMGLAGWLVTAVLWTALIALVVWVIAGLFPERPAPLPSPPVDDRLAGDEAPGRTDVTTVGGRG